MKTITLARKPIVGTVANNVLTHGCGGLNIDASRVGTEDRSYKGSGVSEQRYTDGRAGLTDGRGRDTVYEVTGRFPANLILSHLEGCKRDGLKKVKGNRTDTRPDGDGGREDKSQWRFRPTDQTKRGFSDDDGKETVTNWICELGCPVRTLDDQSGVSKSSGGRTANISTTSTIYGGGKGLGQNLDPDSVKGDPGFGDTGGASRFFKMVKP